MSIPLSGTAPSKAAASTKDERSKNVSPAPRARTTDPSGAKTGVSASQRRRRNQQNSKHNDNKHAQQLSEPVAIPQLQQSTHASIIQNGLSTTEPQSEDSGKPKRRQRMRGKAAMSSGSIPSSKTTHNQQQHHDQQDMLKRSTTAPTVTPVKQAYAGPTFHASPAASALPMPKFLSKSVPDPNAGQGLQSLLETEEAIDVTGAQVNGSQQNTLSTQAVQSPLEIFFKADREEKARRVVSSPDRNSPSRASPLSNRHPTSANHGLATVTSPFKRPVSSGQYGKEMFMMELNDGSPERAFVQSTKQSYSRPNNIAQHADDGIRGNTQRPCGVTENSAFSDPQYARTSVKSGNSQPKRTEQQKPDKSTPYTTPPSQMHNLYSPAMTTPSAETDGEEFLYGNRNLSPLFKATKREHSSPGFKLPSGLRREVTDSLLTASFNNITPNYPSKISVADKPGNNDSASAAAVSRNYLQSHIQPYSDVNNNNTNKESSVMNSSLGSRPFQNPVQTDRRPYTVDGSIHDQLHPTRGSSVTDSGAGRYDATAATTITNSGKPLSKLGSVESMEENLKRLLKLNADS